MNLRNTARRILRAKNISEFHEAASEIGILPSDPRFMTVVIDISNKCNLRCRMCYFSHDEYFKADPVYITPAIFEKLAQSLLPHAVTLTLSCGSEPLTSPYFVDILKIASHYRPPHIDFATNGMLMTEKISDALIEHGVTDVMLSIDAASPKTYEHIRRGADFNRLMRNIEYLVKQKEDRKSTTPNLRINATLMRSNIEELGDLVEMAADLKVTYLDFRHMVVYDGLGMESESLVHHKELTNHWLRIARQKAEKLGLRILTIPNEFEIGDDQPSEPASAANAIRLKEYFSILKRGPKYLVSSAYSRFLDVFKNNRETKNLYCTLPFTYTLINAGAHVLPCPHCHGVAEYGTISLDSSFEDVWFNENFRKLRENIITNHSPEMCRKCSILSMYNINRKNLKPKTA